MGDEKFEYCETDIEDTVNYIHQQFMDGMITKELIEMVLHFEDDYFKEIGILPS